MNQCDGKIRSRKSDLQLRRRVLNELAWDNRVSESNVGVEVDGGVVTLLGTVVSWAEYLAAQEAARRGEGVLDVANDIEVEPPDAYERTDTAIARAVRRALECDVLVPHEKIQSTVSKGVVTLEGQVDRRQQREDAARCLHNLVSTRMRGVVNRIRVEHESDLSCEADDREECRSAGVGPRPGAHGLVRRPRRLA